MMDWTDRHCRFFHRVMTKNALLYTEMVTADAVIHGDREHLLGFDPEEQPVALQLGGSDPVKLGEAARLAAGFGYREINFNVGCPSDRVQSGRFGACLMAEPELTRDCLKVMREAVDIPVTIKCRIGIDDTDTEKDLDRFVDCILESGITTIIVHARKAWLDGLSPKQNRDVPPLDYDRVYRLKLRLPGVTIVINGGIMTLDDARDHLAHTDGVMLGRAAYQSPYILADVDQILFGAPQPAITRTEIVDQMVPYIEAQLAKGTRLHQVTRHMLGLYNGQPNARQWRRHLSTLGVEPEAGIRVLLEARALVEDYPRIAAE
jgi:tRNA-dihydrouridine synthase A